jgi:hypothetical protein
MGTFTTLLLVFYSSVLAFANNSDLEFTHDTVYPELPRFPHWQKLQNGIVYVV